MTFFTLLGASAVVSRSQPAAGAETQCLQLEQLLKLQADGNQKDAYDGLRRFVLEKKTPRPPICRARSTRRSTACQQLNRVDEIDEFREKAVAAHKKDWQLLAAVAQVVLDVPTLTAT